jgi:hypothetical protein
MSEDKIAGDLKITQQAVSKRKRKVIRKLRHILGEARATMLLWSSLFLSAVADPIELPLSCDLWL